MAAVNDIDVTQLAITSNKDIVKTWINKLFWNWYDSNYNYKFRISLFRGLLRPTITIKDVYPVFIILFGPRP